jgi:hypothetical protein
MYSLILSKYEKWFGYGLCTVLDPNSKGSVAKDAKHWFKKNFHLDESTNIVTF